MQAKKSSVGIHLPAYMKIAEKLKPVWYYKPFSIDGKQNN